MCDKKEERKMLARKVVYGGKPNLSKMTKEERRKFIREQTSKICDRNDDALRRLSKN